MKKNLNDIKLNKLNFNYIKIITYCFFYLKRNNYKV